MTEAEPRSFVLFYQEVDTMKRICSEVNEAREFLYKHKSENKVRDYITFSTKKYSVGYIHFISYFYPRVNCDLYAMMCFHLAYVTLLLCSVFVFCRSCVGRWQTCAVRCTNHR